MAISFYMQCYFLFSGQFCFAIFSENRKKNRLKWLENQKTNISPIPDWGGSNATVSSKELQSLAGITPVLRPSDRI